MWLIAGLGNPKIEYLKTRHNAGFLAVDEIAYKFNLTWNNNSKFKAWQTEGEINKQKIIFVKPQTYMDLSGEAILKYMNYYRINLNQLLIIHDDIDINFNEIRVKQGGGNGGHNGLKSIDQHVGQNYWRIRIGVDRPRDNIEVADYVLGKFTLPEIEIIEKINLKIAEYIPLFISGQTAEFKQMIIN